MPVLTLEEIGKDWIIQGMKDRQTNSIISASQYVQFKGQKRASNLFQWFDDAPFAGPELIVTPAPFYYTGKCPDVDDWHFESFFNMDGNQWGKSGLLFYHDRLIGSMERIGERSVLALNNLIDSAGDVLFAMGGIYSISLELEMALREADRRFHPRKFPAIDIARVLGDSPFYIFPRRNINLWSNLPWYNLFQGKAVHDRIVKVRDYLENKYTP